MNLTDDSGARDASTGLPRANRSGDPCPDWCITDHDAILVATESGYVIYTDSHRSAPVGAADVPVKAFQYAGETDIEVSGGYPLCRVNGLDTDQAEALAGILEGVRGSQGLGRLIDDLRAAAAMVKDMDGTQ